MIAIAVDIWKAVDRVSLRYLEMIHCLLLEVMHSSGPRRNLMNLLVLYIRGQNLTCLYQQLRAVILQGFVIFPALFNHFVSDIPIHAFDRTSWC